MKMALFWVFAPCSLVEIYRRFRGACLLIALMMEAATTSETLVNYQTTRRNNPDDGHLVTFMFAIDGSTNGRLRAWLV
jgi:hypothetical protein